MDYRIYQEFRQIPHGIATGETWRLQRHKVIPRSQPVAFFRPEDFVPERFGYDEGIPLYRRDQTRAYTPKPHTLSAQHYYDIFVANQNRRRHSQWDDGKRDRGNVEPDWRTYDRYLSRAKIRDHLRGRDIFGCWGDLYTNWFCVEPDYHGGDPGLFLDILPILDEFTGFFPSVRWFYGLNRNGISGLHLFGLLPEPRLLEEVRIDVGKVLVYLEEENFAKLLNHKPADLPEDQFHPVANLEIYPAVNHNFRLPYARDRITITDEWLNLPGQVDLKGNVVKFMDYVQDNDRQAIPMADVIEVIKASIKLKPLKQTRGSKTTTRPRTSGGTGRGKIQPLKGRHLEFITGVVQGTEPMPADTIGCWATPALRHLMLVDDLDSDEALSKIEVFYNLIPDTSFSDRLSSGNIKELLRTDGYTIKNIENGNLGQARPDESTDKFVAVKARCQQIGFVFADPSTWHVLQSFRALPTDVSDMDFSLTFEEKLAVREPGAAILKCDVPSVYQVAHRIKAYVTKYPGKELPAILVPIICADLPITWFVASDAGSRCRMAEKFLALLCSLGIIKMIQEKQWFGPGHPKNRGAKYGLPKDEMAGGYLQWPRIIGRGEDKEESIYITDTSVFSELDYEELILEVRRFNRPWTPQYHDSG